MSLFFVIFLSLYFLLNFYVLRRVYNLFKIKPRIGFYLLLVILSLSFISAKILERRFDNIAVRIFDSLAASWMGIGLILLACLVVYEAINLLAIALHLSSEALRQRGALLPKPAVGWIVVAVTIILIVYSAINALMLQVTNIDILAPVDMTIVQLSDIHLGSTSKKYLQKVVEKTNALSPDMVLITGDLIDSRHELIAGSLSVLNDLNSPVFYVIGNHDRYMGLWQVEEFLRTKTKVKILRNRKVDFNGIQIIGIDDKHDQDQVEKQLAEIKYDPARYTVLMYHRPEGLSVASKEGINLMLAGHTHNGQIFPFNYFVRMRHRYMKGLFANDDCLLYVSAGTGTWGPRMRLGSRSEIVLLKLCKTSLKN